MREEELALLKKQIESVNQEELYAEGDAITMNEKLEELHIASSSVKKRHEVSQMDTKIYFHMLERMKKDMVAMKIRTNELETSIQHKDSIFDKEYVKSKKSQESRLQSKFKLDNLLTNVDVEQSKIQDRIKSLQNSIKNKEEAVSRRMERVKRQQDIADAAANDNKDSDEIKMRENFMAQKLWAVFLKKKMEKEMVKSAEVEDAFQTIRAATGMTDIHSIVQKFLTREQTYSQLLVNVAESERKIDTLKKENEELMNELYEVMIDKDGMNGDGKGLNPEIEELSSNINELTKEVEECKDRSQKVEIVTDQIFGWCQKVLKKMKKQYQEFRVDVSDDLLDDLEKLKNKISLTDLFEKISGCTCSQLEQLIADEVSEEDRYITLKDFLNDFASPDFVAKNIRVRPMSARTNADESQKAEQAAGAQSRNMGKSNDGAKEDQNDVRSILFEIEQQRKNIKDKHTEVRKKKIAEIERKKKM
jgi:chromosome segregation ATPase